MKILTGKYGYLVDRPLDGPYVADDNCNDPGSNQVPGLEQHKDVHMNIYPHVLRDPI